MQAENTAERKISAEERKLLDIFNDHYQFTVPLYQRPYSWTPEEADELLSDLQDAMEYGAKDSEYFLGSIVLVKRVGQPEAEIIDGQQRLTTLTILLATLRDLTENDKNKAELNRFIWQVGGTFAETTDRVRLQIRDRDNDYFRHNVQEEGAVERLAATSCPKLSDAQNNVRRNALHFWKKLGVLDASAREGLGLFLMQHCHLVVVSTSDRKSAYRIFSVMNTRGLDLSSADILKAEIIGAIGDSDRERYAKKWEDIEESLTRDDFEILLGHVRMIFRKEKQRKNVIDEFLDAVIPKPKECPKDFLKDVLEPMAKAYRQIKESDFESEDEQQRLEINRYFRLLNRLDNKDWAPAAISFVARRGADAARVLSFLKSLEKLAYGMFVLRHGVNDRIKRYVNALSKIEGGNESEIEESMILSDEDKLEIRHALNGEVYSVKQIRAQILERINDALTEAGCDYAGRKPTVEHILPQTPRGEWLDNFDEEQRDCWTHRIANLVLLSRQKNSAAKNYSFERKKDEYFFKGGSSPFSLTNEIRGFEKWTPECLEERQERLLQKFDEIWDLGGAS